MSFVSRHHHTPSAGHHLSMANAEEVTRDLQLSFAISSNGDQHMRSSLAGIALTIAFTTVVTMSAMAASPEQIARENALFDSIRIQPQQLKPLALETPIVADGRPAALICHADDPQWHQAALTVQQAIADATGVTLDLTTDTELSTDQADATNLILLGHLDNNALVARLYHNFFVCLDTGYTGRTGYVIRSVHDPFGTGHNTILVGGSFPEGTLAAAQEFSRIISQAARGDSLTLGRLLTLNFDETDRAEPLPTPVTEQQRDAAIAEGRKAMFEPGRGRVGTARLVQWGETFHRTADPFAGEIYHALMQALLEYYQTDEYITTEGLGRYDRDFRDAWTFTVAICFDLLEGKRHLLRRRAPADDQPRAQARTRMRRLPGLR